MRYVHMDMAGGYMVWGLRKLYADVVGVHGAYVTYKCT